jgi:hypothetical protein
MTTRLARLPALKSNLYGRVIFCQRKYRWVSHVFGVCTDVWGLSTLPSPSSSTDLSTVVFRWCCLVCVGSSRHEPVMSTVTTFRQIRRNNESMINRQYLEFSAENVKPHSRSSLRSFLGNDQSIILRRCKQLIRRKVEDDNGICQV